MHNEYDIDKVEEHMTLETYNQRNKEKIKVKTYDNMYYTYCYIDNEVDRELREQEINTSLIILYKIINEDKFIFLPLEDKILNTNDIKETLIGF